MIHIPVKFLEPQLEDLSCRVVALRDEWLRILHLAGVDIKGLPNADDMETESEDILAAFVATLLDWYTREHGRAKLDALVEATSKHAVQQLGVEMYRNTVERFKPKETPHECCQP